MSPAPLAVALRSLALVAALSLVLAGCTTSGDGAGASRSAPPRTSAPPPSTPQPSATLTPTPTLSPSETSTPSTPASTPPVGSTAAVSSVRECGLTDLTLRVIRGGAAANEQIALLTFTNTSSTECSIVGFPGVSLRLRGAQLGAPAGRSSKPGVTVRLKPGASANATLTDVSTCQAALSDTVRVYPPDSTGFFDKPLVLRGCMLYIDPVAPA